MTRENRISGVRQIAGDHDLVIEVDGVMPIEVALAFSGLVVSLLARDTFAAAAELMRLESMVGRQISRDLYGIAIDALHKAGHQ